MESLVYEDSPLADYLEGMGAIRSCGIKRNFLTLRHYSQARANGINTGHREKLSLTGMRIRTIMRQKGCRQYESEHTKRAVTRTQRGEQGPDY